MMPYHKKIITAAGGQGSYATRSVRFDGTNDYLTRGADFTSNADGKQGIFSAWLNFQGGDGVLQRIMASTGNAFQVRKNTSNSIILEAENAATTTILSITSSNLFTASSGWIHILAAWDLANTTAQMYINDASDVSGAPTATNDTIDYTQAEHTIGASIGTGNKLNAEVADFYFNNSEYLDISVEANRRRFINSAGKPVNLFSDASSPTGSQPILYLRRAATGETVDDFYSNNGDGGGMTENGSLSAGTSSPSD